MKTQNPTINEKVLYYLGYVLPKIGGSFSYEKMLKFINDYYNESCSIRTLRKEFSILKNKGFFDYKTYYNKKVPILSANGKLAISPILAYRKYGPWDSKWRVVVFSVSEHDRKCKNLFIGKLDELKFKKIFKGVYIGPHPVLSIISKYANELGLRQKCVLFETDRIDQETKTIQKIWDIDKVNKKYGQFIKFANSKLADVKEHWALEAKELEKAFISIYNEDAHLPKDFLPKNWQGDEAYELFKRISNSYKVSK